MPVLSVSASPHDTYPAIGLEQWLRLDMLPRFRHSIRTDSISSYDRSGGNDDGFSGKYSYVRKEGDGLVIADLKGPGCIYRIWTPTPTDDTIEFYFDGETAPRVHMKYRELFLGSKAPFKAPICGYGSGGFYCYLPMPYKISCKVIIRAPLVQFYQINYATYGPDTPVNSFDPNSTALAGELMARAQKIFDSTGRDLSTMTSPAGASLKVVRSSKTLSPGKSITLFETSAGGRITGIRLKNASAFATKDRSVVLKITWDGEKEPAVLCPAGDFFGAAWGKPAMRSLLIGTDTDSDTDYCYFPMPFEKSARIELISDAIDGAPLPVSAEIVVSRAKKRTDEGRFYALWRRENPTTNGKPFNYVTTRGRGHLVGVTLQAQGSIPGITPFFEGDDQATLDGELRIHGTGSEDFFNGGWYDVPGRWEERASYPLSGCLQYSRPLARSGGYRLFLMDEYSFQKSVQLDMEHAPEKNDYIADYVGVTFLYLEADPSPGWTLPDLGSRKVIDPTRLVFSPGWYTPIHAFSMQNATLTKRSEQFDREHRSLSLQTSGENLFGDHLISFLCTVPASGKYRVSIEPIVGPEQCVVQLFFRERAVGDSVDTYAAKRSPHTALFMGELELKEGPNQIFFKLIGKNPAATGNGLRFDLETILLDRTL